MYRTAPLFALLLCPALSALAQPGPGAPPGVPRQDQIEVEPPQDSTIRYVRGDDLYDVHALQISDLGPLTHQYDPVRLQFIDQANLGNPGSAHRPLLFEMDRSKGLTLGQDQYRLYQGSFESFRFYDTEQAMTEFDYSQGVDQLDGILKARFGRNFSDGVKLSIDYMRINQVGQFTHQQGKHTRFGMGIWYDAPGGKYDGLYYYGSNSNVQQDNGGITDYVILDTAELENEVPVELTDALTTQRFRTVVMQNHFHLVGRNDTVQRRGGVDLIHTFQHTSGFVKFSDENLANDTDYYGLFVTDDRGMRHFIDRKVTENSMDVQLRIRSDTPDSTVYQVLRLGLQHRYNNLYQEPVREHINELFFQARTELNLGNRITLAGRGYIALQGQTGDFRISGELSYKTQSEIKLSGGLDLYHRSPNLVERRLFVVKVPVWERDFDNITHSRIHARALFGAINLELRGAAHVVDNHIYFDTLRQPAQLGTSAEVLQIAVRKSLHVGNIGAAGTVLLQTAPERLAVPGIWAKLSLFYRDFWFGNQLEVQMGGDLRISDDYPGVNYFPVTGQFHLDDSRMITSYPAVDVFFDIQVKKSFRMYIKFENVSAFFRSDPFLQVVDYPHFASYFRVGLWMKLYD